MRGLLLALGLLLPVAASAQQSTQYTTYSGTMTISAATSTALTAANVTMAPNATLPPTFKQLQVINVGSNSVYVCWQGGTCGTNVGGELLIAGASDFANLPNQTVPPTFYSTSGTTIAFRN